MDWATLVSAFIGAGAATAILNFVFNLHLNRQQSKLTREATVEARRAERVERALPRAWAAFKRAKRASEKLADAEPAKRTQTQKELGYWPLPETLNSDFYDARSELRSVQLDIPENLYRRMDEVLTLLHPLSVQAYWATAGLKDSEAIHSMLEQFQYQAKKRKLDKDAEAIRQDIRKRLGTAGDGG